MNFLVLKSPLHPNTTYIMWAERTEHIRISEHVHNIEILKDTVTRNSVIAQYEIDSEYTIDISQSPKSSTDKMVQLIPV